MSDSVQASVPEKRGIGVIRSFFKKHKAIAILLLLLLAAVIAVVWFGRGRAVSGKTEGSYSFIRTTTLRRGDLDETVSTTGSVESADTSTVTYAMGAGSSAKIKAIHVAVGDEVEAGDVIVTLDNADILESIAKAEEALSKQKIAAQESYDEAIGARDEAYNAAVAYENTVAEAKTTMDNALAAYTVAKDSVAAVQLDYDTKLSAQQSKGAEYNLAATEYSAALTAMDQAQKEYDAAETAYAAELEKLQQAEAAAEADPENAELAAAAADAKSALAAAEENRTAKQTALNEAESALNAAKKKEQQASDAYESAAGAAAQAQQLLSEQKRICGYDELEKSYQAAQQSYNTARTTLNNYEKQYDTACDQVEQAEEKLQDAETSETLEDLYDQLKACELTAETSGKVTSLNATVGSAPNGTIAVIQNTEQLKVSITVSEADINSVEIGMRCVITSDATEREIDGVLTQLDPVAGQNGSFGAEVTVSEQDTGLLIGMNAAVKIVISSTEDVFTVPLDAVGNDNDGKGDYVYRKTGGEGVDMTFEKVYVSTGESNDYYVRISGDLAEGDVIRSSADLTQGLETVEDASDVGFRFDSMLGGGVNGDRNRGEMSGTRPGGNFGGDTMPSGDMGGGPGGNGS